MGHQDGLFESFKTIGSCKVKNERNFPPLRQNATLAQIRKHEDLVTKRPKALTCIHLAASEMIFTRITV